MHASRIHHHPGAPNFRDLGGLPTIDGFQVKPGRVYRAAMIKDSATAATLAGLGIDLICDLRSLGERSKRPHLWPTDVEFLLCQDQDSDELNPLKMHQRMSALADDLDQAIAMMCELYSGMPRVFGPVLHSLLTRLSEEAAPSVLVHCTAGKDRTGFICALLLSALGVPRELIFDDYLLTQVLYPPAQVVSDSLGTPLVAESELAGLSKVLAGIEARYLEASFKVIDAEFGNVEDYLSALGCDESQRRRLRSQLLVPSSQ